MGNRRNKISALYLTQTYCLPSLLYTYTQVFLSKNRNILVKAYVTYVRPLLELDDIAKIESVQRRFIKRLPGLSNTSYSNRLAVLGLRSLQLR